jgi:F-type H+-transporting ATPase subunit epsilon
MTVEVHIVTPVREVWTGDVQELIARGVDGEVGILGGHAPLLVQLAIGPLRMLTESGETRAVIDGGFLHVSTHEGATRADVLAAYAELEQEIDVEAARARLAELEGRSIEDDDEVAKGEIAKATARIKLAG